MEPSSLVGRNHALYWAALSIVHKEIVKNALYFLIIKIKHKKQLFFYHHWLTKGQSVRPPHPNIPINNYSNIVLLVSHFNLTDICHHCLQKRRRKKKSNAATYYRWTEVTLSIQMFFYTVTLLPISASTLFSSLWLPHSQFSINTLIYTGNATGRRSHTSTSGQHSFHSLSPK